MLHISSLGRIAACLAGGLLFSAGLRAETTAGNGLPPANPYGSIVIRNVFNLTGPSLSPPTPPTQYLPQITVTGYYSVFNQTRVLFKIPARNKPGQPAKDHFYNLGEGQQEDDVEVIRIDKAHGMVKFNNHGSEQDLPLADMNPPPAPL